jgi:hypothetical protein
MQTQEDYEADVVLGAFLSAESARSAVRALHAAGINAGEAPLAPGHYQLADVRVVSRMRTVLRAAIVGAIVGAVIGVVVAVLWFGSNLYVILGFAVAGLFGGGIVAPLFGIEQASRYDEDVARTIDIVPDSAAFVIRAETAPAGARASARQILERAGTVGILDVATYESTLRGSTEPTVVESTSAGDSAAPQAPRFGRGQVSAAEDVESKRDRHAA